MGTTDSALRLFDIYAGHGYRTYGEVDFPSIPIKAEDEYGEVPHYPLWELFEGEEESDVDVLLDVVLRYVN